MKTYSKYKFTILFYFGLISIFSQNSKQNLWTIEKMDNINKAIFKHRSSTPDDYIIYRLNLNLLKQLVEKAPKREDAVNSKIEVLFPNTNGILELFKVYESSIMHPDLQAKYPMIKTYAAQGIDDPTATMRFSITQFGFHAMTLSGKHVANYIDPYTTDLNNYIVYSKIGLKANYQINEFECLTDEGVHYDKNYTNSLSRNNVNDQVLRKYRLAQSCTAEYGNIFTTGSGTDAQNKADIQAQMTITINRVNEIYERDLAITLEFIPNNDLLIYYGNTNSDPWTNEWNNKTQQVIDNTIGDTNYDIGHNFNTTGGGNAGCIACVCTSGSKGSGYTGRSDPTGDAFDIDYVTHEMGHQFGGYHTMNTCSRSGSGTTEVEPASGSSIMGYAGICATNVQANSDAHFNYVNIRDITQNIQTGNSTCGAQTALANNPPTADAGLDYTIPKSTAFVLEGVATDLDGMASLTYNWSQNDPEQAPGNGSPQPSWDVGPLYRSKLPITSKKRYLPQFSDVLQGNLTPTWEVTPDVARNMEFSFVVRDNDVLGGQTASDLMAITVDGNSGPFTVTSQVASETWNSGDTKTITWNVANTNNAPVNAANVDIFITSDGETLTLVASNVSNNGSYNIAVPSNINSTNARILVKGHNNIFYAINAANLTIQDNEFSMDFNSTTQTVCAPNNATYQFTYHTYNGFNEMTTFSTTGEPAGSTITFNPIQASANNTNVSLTVSNITNAMLGSYNIIVTGTANSATKTSNITLNIQNSTFTNTNLTAPSDGSTNIATNTNFTWNADANADSYFIEIASDSNFNNIVENATTATNSFQASSLSTANTYYWRVTYSNNCGSYTTNPFSFTTINCTLCSSVGNNSYQTSTTRVQFNTIDNPSGKSDYSDFTNISTDIELTNSYNLSVNVNTDGTYTIYTKVWIDWNQDCDFDDPNEEFDLGTANNTSNGATTNSPLSITVPANANLGTTTMRVSSKYNAYATSCENIFDGEVEDYSLNVIEVPLCPNETIWTGTWSNGVPDATKRAIINSNYSTATNGVFTACELSILDQNATLTVNANQYIKVINSFVNNGSIIIENTGSFVQVADDATVTGTGNFNTNIQTSQLVDPSRFTYFSSPVQNQDLSVFNSWGNMNKLWRFDESIQDWYMVPANSMMIPAVGYAIQGAPDTGQYPFIGYENFTGAFNNGIYSYPLTYNAGGTDDDNALVGNPYPSAVDAALLLSNNSSANAFYFWTHNSNLINGGSAYASDDYAIWNASGGTAATSGSPAPTGFIASGQGFFVSANSNGSITFNNAYRVIDNNTDFRRPQNINRDRIWLNLSNDSGYFNQLLVNFTENGSSQFDNKLDAIRFNTGNTVSFYSIGINNEQFAIQALNNIDNDTTVPLGYKINSTTISSLSISLDHLDFQNDTSIYLKDNLLNITYDLQLSDYIFNVTQGEFNNRFELIFQRNALTISDENISNENLIVSNYSKKEIKINTKNGQNYTQIKIFDILGKEIINKQITTNSTILQTNIHKGTVLFVKVKLENGRMLFKKFIKY